jgi:hypothetical protein
MSHNLQGASGPANPKEVNEYSAAMNGLNSRYAIRGETRPAKKLPLMRQKGIS